MTTFLAKRVGWICVLTGLATSDLAAQAPQVVLDIPAIAGKSPAEVEQTLGPPSGQEATKSGGRTYPKLFYRNGDVEVVYVDDKADWITLYEALPLRKESLLKLGLPVQAPTFARRGAMMRWEGNIPGIMAVHLFPSYVYINVRTTP